MKHKLHILVGIVCLASITIHGKAQNVSAELMLLQSKYTNLDNYSVAMSYKAYKGHASPQVADMQSGLFEVYHKKMRFVMGDIEVMQNGKYTIQVDRSVQEIDIEKTPETWVAPVFGNFSSLDSILRRNNAIFFKQEPSSRVLLFNLIKSGEEYEKIEIRYLPSGDIISITLFYRALSDAYGVEGAYKPRVEIKYSHQNFNPGFTDEHFSEQKYFRLKEGKAIPTNSFKNYKIFDRL